MQTKTPSIRRWRLLVLVIWGVFAIYLTTQSAGNPLIDFMASTIGSTEAGDLIGHAGLFAVLTAVGYLALSLKLKPRQAIVIAMVVTLAIGIITEIAQGNAIGRTVSAADLLANWLGTFVVGFCVAYLAMKREH